MEWIVSALAAAAGLLQKERDRGRVVVEAGSGFWPAANPQTIIGRSVGQVQVTNHRTQAITVTGMGFSVRGRPIALVNTDRPLAAYLLPGQSVTGISDLSELAHATNLGVDGAYAHVAGMSTVRVKVKTTLFYPLYLESAA